MINIAIAYILMSLHILDMYIKWYILFMDLYLGDVYTVFIFFYPQLLGAGALAVGIWGLVSSFSVIDNIIYHVLIVWCTLLHCHMESDMSHDHM